MFTNPGVSEFKSRFDRDFPFSTDNVQATASVTVNAAQQVTALTPVERGRGYTSAPRVTITDSNDGPGIGATATANISKGQVSSYTVTAPGAGYIAPVASIRGGGVDDTDMDFVRDKDVTWALSATQVNPGNFPTQDNYSYAFLLKAAHFLCINLRSASQGLRGRGAQWLQASFTVGDISANYEIPESVKQSKILAPYLETTYGCQYLQLVAPSLVGNVRGAIGWTKP